KSSLVQAAVFPTLVDAREVRVVRVDAWPEGEEPTSWLARAVFSELRFGDVPADQSTADAVLFAVKRAARASERLVIVYLDQLEQLFFTGRSSDETENFFKCLQALVDLPVRSLRLVLSLREDYLGRFRDRLRDRGRLLENTFRVGPLDVRELTEAVCQAARAGEPSQEWKPEAIRNLMLQVRVPGQAATDEAEAQAAYAQIVCRALFQERAQGQSIADDKVEAEPIMVRYLDSTLSSLGKLDEPARRLLGDHMVTSDGSRTLRTEKELLRLMPEAELFPILEALEKAAILHAAEHQGSRYFEIGHDWLARKVFDERALREAREAAKKHQAEMQRQFDEKQKEIAQRLDDERKRRKRLAHFSGATLSVAILTSALGILAYRSQKAAESARRDATRAQYEALRKRIEASDQRLLVGYAALSNQGHQSIALKLLPEVKFPQKISGWLSVASDALSETRLRVTLSGHTGPIVVTAFSPNGQHVLTASGDGTARIWNANGDGLPVILSGHKDAILTAAWSPDGRRVLTTSGDGTACIWNANGEGSPIRIDPGVGPIWAGAFAPDGRHVALGLQDGSLRVFGLDGQSTVTLAAKNEKLAGFHALAFVRGSEQLVGATNDGAVHLWSLDAPSKPTEVGRHEARIESLAVSADGTKLLTAAGESSAKLFFLDGKKATKPRLLSCDQGSAIQSALSPDGSLAAISCNDFRVRIFSTNEDKPPVVLNAATAFITKLAFRDNSFLAVSSIDSVARVYSVAGGPARLELHGHTGAIGVLSFSPDRKWLVTGAADDRTKDFTAKVWNVAALDELPAPIRTQLPYHGIAVRKDGIFVAGAFDDDVVRVRRVDGKGQTVELRGHNGWISRVAWAPDGERIVTSSFDQTARVWRADGTGDPIILGGKDNDGHTAGLRYAAFSRDGTLVVTASEDRTAKVWHANRVDKPLVTLSGHDDWVTAASIAPDGKRVATACQDHAVRVFSLDKPAEPLVFRTHQASVNSVQFSPDGSRIASASDDGTVRIIFAENQEMP
ncbi:MAG TPA: hypothetical protein PK156_46665, partial [Polyangium sp.]|nr:hypothetical protein [Polyangium sp.]